MILALTCAAAILVQTPAQTVAYQDCTLTQRHDAVARTEKESADETKRIAKMKKDGKG